MESSLAAGFQTPIVEIIAVAVVIAGVIAGFALYTLRKNHIERQERELGNAARYRELVQFYGLTRSDEDAVERLARHLRDPSQRHLLLQSQGVFNQSAALALEDDAVGAGHISALRVKLGYSGRLIGLQPRSSVDIPPGSGVLVSRGGTQWSRGTQRERSARRRSSTSRRDLALPAGRDPVPGTVVGVDSGTFRIVFDADDLPFGPASTVHVVYQNDAGVFEFDSVVLKREARIVDLQHVESITSLQQRRHYRRSITLPVYVSDVLTVDDATATEFLDIGGGGASFHNPEKRFRRGDTVELSFHPDEKDELSLTATVVRTSRDGSVAHVRYGQIREASRDRIYRLLFDPRRAPLRHVTGTNQNSAATTPANDTYITRKNQSGKS